MVTLGCFHGSAGHPSLDLPASASSGQTCPRVPPAQGLGPGSSPGQRLELPGCFTSGSLSFLIYKRQPLGSL